MKGRSNRVFSFLKRSQSRQGEAYWSYSDIGGRRQNEDAVGVTIHRKGLVAVVCDGLGGQGDGNLASSLVCKELLSSGGDGELPTPEALQIFFSEANQKLMAAQKNSFHMKTTAVYLCLRQERAIWAHVGDSRLYHFENGELAHFTLDHSASQMAVFLGQIRREEIPGDTGRSRLLRVMGVEEEKADICGPVDLGPGRHVFFLCTDGLWEYLKEEEIAAASRCATAREMVETLVDIKKTRSPENCDNNSAVAVIWNVK